MRINILKYFLFFITSIAFGQNEFDKNHPLLLSLIPMMGEFYQNNHDKTPNKMNFVHLWFEIDLGCLLASLLQKLNVIQINKGV